MQTFKRHSAREGGLDSSRMDGPSALAFEDAVQPELQTQLPYQDLDGTSGQDARDLGVFAEVQSVADADDLDVDEAAPQAEPQATQPPSFVPIPAAVPQPTQPPVVAMPEATQEDAQELLGALHMTPGPTLLPMPFLSMATAPPVAPVAQQVVPTVQPATLAVSPQQVPAPVQQSAAATPTTVAPLAQAVAVAPAPTAAPIVQPPLAATVAQQVVTPAPLSALPPPLPAAAVTPRPLPAAAVTPPPLPAAAVTPVQQPPAAPTQQAVAPAQQSAAAVAPQAQQAVAPAPQAAATGTPMQPQQVVPPTQPSAAAAPLPATPLVTARQSATPAPVAQQVTAPVAQQAATPASSSPKRTNSQEADADFYPTSMTRGTQATSSQATSPASTPTAAPLGSATPLTGATPVPVAAAVAPPVSSVTPIPASSPPVAPVSSSADSTNNATLDSASEEVSESDDEEDIAPEDDPVWDKYKVEDPQVSKSMEINEAPERRNKATTDGSTGAKMEISESGFERIKKLNCELEMEQFMRRFLVAKGYKLCSEGGMQGLLHFYWRRNSTNTYEHLLEEVSAATKGNCPWVTPDWVDDCPEMKEGKCLDVPDNGKHRRRSCVGKFADF